MFFDLVSTTGSFYDSLSRVVRRSRHAPEASHASQHAACDVALVRRLHRRAVCIVFGQHSFSFRSRFALDDTNSHERSFLFFFFCAHVDVVAVPYDGPLVPSLEDVCIHRIVARTRLLRCASSFFASLSYVRFAGRGRVVRTHGSCGRLCFTCPVACLARIHACVDRTAVHAACLARMPSFSFLFLFLPFLLRTLLRHVDASLVHLVVCAATSSIPPFPSHGASIVRVSPPFFPLFEREGLPLE